MFASIKKSCTFVLGLSKEVLSPINLLVISFSVINYVVSVSCRREGHNSFLFYTLFSAFVRPRIGSALFRR